MSEDQKQFQSNSSAIENVQLIELLKKNEIFDKLPFSVNLIKELSRNIEVTKILETKKIPIDFQILLVLEGSVHEYVPNSWDNILKNWENKLVKRQLLLFKKINQNDFYSSYHPKYGHNQSQLVAQEGSSIVKISDQLFSRYFERKLESHMKEIIQTLRGFDFTKSFKMETLYDLAKHVKEERFREGTVLYEKGMTSRHFYFIKSGSVELYERRPGRAERQRYNLNTILGKNKVVGLDGIVTPTQNNKRLFTCEVITTAEMLTLEKRILIILICSAKERDASKQSYHQINLTDQFQHRARQSEITVNRSQLKQTLTNNFKSKTKSIIDIMRLQNQMPLINKTPELSYQSTPLSFQNNQTTSQFLPQSRISVIKMGDNEEDDDEYYNKYSHPSSPTKSLSLKKRSLTLLKSNPTKSKYRRQYHKEMRQLVEVKKLQEQNAKIKIVSQSKFDERLKSTSRIKRILVCSKPTNEQTHVEEVLFRRLEALNHNPLLLNFENNRKRLLLQLKKSVSK